VLRLRQGNIAYTLLCNVIFQTLYPGIKLSITAISVGKKNISLSDFSINQSSVPYFSSLNRLCISFFNNNVSSRFIAASSYLPWFASNSISRFATAAFHSGNLLVLNDENTSS
jgi:hypothetical protein